jgi:hypothetical protein
MWQNISRRLDEDDARKKQKSFARSEQWRPALVLAVAAGFFWFALIPALPGTRTGLPGQGSTFSGDRQYPNAEVGAVQGDYLNARRTTQPVVAFVEEQARSFRNVPQ